MFNSLAKLRMESSSINSLITCTSPLKNTVPKAPPLSLLFLGYFSKKSSTSK